MLGVYARPASLKAAELPCTLQEAATLMPLAAPRPQVGQPAAVPGDEGATGVHPAQWLQGIPGGTCLPQRQLFLRGRASSCQILILHLYQLCQQAKGYWCACTACANRPPALLGPQLLSPGRSALACPCVQRYSTDTELIVGDDEELGSDSSSSSVVGAPESCCYPVGGGMAQRDCSAAI